MTSNIIPDISYAALISVRCGTLLTSTEYHVLLT